MREPQTAVGAMPWRRLGVLSLMAVIALSCGQTRPAGAAQSTPATAARDGYHLLLSGSRDTGRIAAGQPVAFDLILANPEAAGLKKAIAAIYDPHSPSYGHFLTPAEAAARFGPAPGRAAGVIEWLRAHGLGGAWTPGTGAVTATGPAAAVEKAFRIRLDAYRAPNGSRFYAGWDDPRVPPELAAAVVGSSHVTDYRFVKTYAIRPGGLQPSDLQLVYDTQPLRAQGIDGTGETVVLWAAGDNINPQHYSTFNQHFGLPDTPVVLGGGPPLGSGKEEGELIMDVETVHEIAPGARIIVYTTPATQVDQVMTGEAPMFTANPGSIFSFSIGFCETVFSSAAATSAGGIYDQAAAAGSTIFVSTGDSGAYTCQELHFGSPPSPAGIGTSVPSIFPGVTAVGGTTVSQDAKGGWYDETVWEGPNRFVGSGGGISQYFAMPDWQRTVPGALNQFNTTKRSVPDISAVADPASGTAIFGSSGWQTGGGTSLSSPMWAGFAALMNQYLKRNGGHPLGFFNPALYAVASTPQPFGAFHDITVGTNLAYPATPGYDLATGIGSADVWNLTQDLLAYQKSGGK